MLKYTKEINCARVLDEAARMRERHDRFANGGAAPAEKGEEQVRRDSLSMDSKYVRIPKAHVCAGSLPGGVEVLRRHADIESRHGAPRLVLLAIKIGLFTVPRRDRVPPDRI